jgi:hypothetical protein
VTAFFRGGYAPPGAICGDCVTAAATMLPQMPAGMDAVLGRDQEDGAPTNFIVPAGEKFENDPEVGGMPTDTHELRFDVGG